MKYRLPPDVLPQSEQHFFSPSDLARNTLFYQVCCGHFYTTEDYRTKRDSFPGYHFFYIAKGEYYFKTPDESFVAHAGELAFVNTYEPHEYGSTIPSEIYWVVFDGIGLSKYHHAIRARHSGLFNKEEGAVFNTFLVENFQQYEDDPPFAIKSIGKSPIADLRLRKFNVDPTGEVVISIKFYESLCTLLVNSYSDEADNVLTPAIEYIHKNFSQQITVKDLAGQSNCSEAHFSRLFREKFNVSPYEYLVQYRINTAKYLLKNSNASVEDIAYSTGFNSSSNFITCFKSRIGLAPGQFRKLE